MSQTRKKLSTGAMPARTPLDSIFDRTRLLYARVTHERAHTCTAYVSRIWKVVRSKRAVC